MAIELQDAEGKKKSQATLLIEIGGQAELFHNPDGDPFVAIPVDDHREVWPLRSKPAREWLQRQHFLITGRGCNAQALQDAIDTLSAKARFDGPEQEVCIRVAADDERIIIDIGGPDWEAIEVTASCWHIRHQSPARLTRTPKTLPLPKPAKGRKGIREFQRLFGLSDKNLVLIVAWLLAALRGKRPFPVLILEGEQGTGKSTLARACKALSDPATNALRSPPKDEKDLGTAALNCWVLSLDNLSGLNPSLSDVICRISTGGSISARKLYTDGEEFSAEITRPVLLNGIDEIATRPDLLDRALIIRLDPIPETERQTERVLWRKFEAIRPALFAELLVALKTGLANLERITLPRLPRMADFAQWIVAAESALPWPPGKFLEVYRQDIDEQARDVIEGTAFGAELLKLIRTRDEFSGTATELLQAINWQADPTITRSKFWPVNPKAVGNAVRQLAPALRRAGITVEFDRVGKNRERRIQLRISAETPSAPSTTSADYYEASRGEGSEADRRRTLNDHVMSASKADNGADSGPSAAGADKADDGFRYRSEADTPRHPADRR